MAVTQWRGNRIQCINDDSLPRQPSQNSEGLCFLAFFSDFHMSAFGYTQPYSHVYPQSSITPHAHTCMPTCTHTNTCKEYISIMYKFLFFPLIFQQYNHMYTFKCLLKNKMNIMQQVNLELSLEIMDVISCLCFIQQPPPFQIGRFTVTNFHFKIFSV